MTKHRQDKHRFGRRGEAVEPDGFPEVDEAVERVAEPVVQPVAEPVVEPAPTAAQPAEPPAATHQIRPPTVPGKRVGERAPEVDFVPLPAPRVADDPEASPPDTDQFTVPMASYGSSRPRGTWIALVVAGLLAVVILVVIVMNLFPSSPGVTSELTGFEFDGGNTAIATVDVELGKGVAADCVVQALAEDHSVVGEQHFTPVQGLNRVAIHTERQATAVNLIGCTTRGQNRPR